MKQNVKKKPFALSAGSAKKTTGAKKPAKKKKRGKLTAGDKIRAVLVAAALITAAAAVSLTLVYYKQVKERDKTAETAALSGEKTAGTGGSGADAPPGVVSRGGEPVSRPLPAPVSQNAPAVKAAPVVKPRVPDEKPDASAVKPSPAAEPAPAGNPRQPPRTVPAAEIPPPPAASPPSAGRPAVKGALVFVIDDAGHNLRDLEPFLKFPGPLTIAVLPGLPYSAEAARRIRAAGKEVFLHQPMEALGGQDPGPGAIRAGMGRDEIRAVISRNLDEVGPVAGINNHEGSRISGDEQAMETVLSLCRERGIPFLDSRTTAETAAPRTARRLGMIIGERDVFVDNIQDRDSMKSYIETGLRKAEQKGAAIMIGHVWSPELSPLLTELFPDLEERGYTFSPASKIMGGR